MNLALFALVLLPLLVLMALLTRGIARYLQAAYSRGEPTMQLKAPELLKADARLYRTMLEALGFKPTLFRSHDGIYTLTGYATGGKVAVSFRPTPDYWSNPDYQNWENQHGIDSMYSAMFQEVQRGRLVGRLAADPSQEGAILRGHAALERRGWQVVEEQA